MGEGDVVPAGSINGTGCASVPSDRWQGVALRAGLHHLRKAMIAWA